MDLFSKFFGGKGNSKRIVLNASAGYPRKRYYMAEVATFSGDLSEEQNDIIDSEWCEIVHLKVGEQAELRYMPGYHPENPFILRTSVVEAVNKTLGGKLKITTKNSEYILAPLG